MRTQGSKNGLTKEMQSMLKRNMPKDSAIDKIKLHIISGGKKPLGEIQQETYTQLQYCRTIMEGGGSRQDIVKMIVVDLQVSEPRAYAIYQDTVKLYADISKITKDEWRWVISEQLLSLAKKAGEDKLFQIQLDALVAAGKIQGLTNQEVLERVKAEMPNITIQIGDYKELEKQVETIPHVEIE